jgi:hypothetical protein
MTIHKAVEQDGYLLIYNKKGRVLCSFSIEPGVLLDHTANTFRVREGLDVYTFDEKGNRLSHTRVRRVSDLTKNSK